MHPSEGFGRQRKDDISTATAKKQNNYREVSVTEVEETFPPAVRCDRAMMC